MAGVFTAACSSPSGFFFFVAVVFMYLHCTLQLWQLASRLLSEGERLYVYTSGECKYSFSQPLAGKILFPPTSIGSEEEEEMTESVLDLFWVQNHQSLLFDIEDEIGQMLFAGLLC